MYLSSMNSDPKCHSILDVFHKEVRNIAASLDWTKLSIVMLMLTYPLRV